MKVPKSVEPGLDFVVTDTLIVVDIARSTAFYRDVLGARGTWHRRAKPSTARQVGYLASGSHRGHRRRAVVLASRSSFNPRQF